MRDGKNEYDSLNGFSLVVGVVDGGRRSPGCQ